MMQPKPLNDEIKGANARGVDVDIVLARDQGSQEMIGQSNRESANELTAFRRDLADFHGEQSVGKLKLGWFKGPPRDLGDGNIASVFNPTGAGEKARG